MATMNAVEDTAPLVPAGKSNTTTNNSNTSNNNNGMRGFLQQRNPYLVVIYALAFVGVVSRGHVMKPKGNRAGSSSSGIVSKANAAKSSNIPKPTLKPLRPIPNLIAADTMRKGSDLQTTFRAGRQALVAELQALYGVDAYQKIFLNSAENGPSSSARQAYTAVHSVERLKKRVLMKLLRVLQVAQNSKRHEFLPAIPFVWATGGHSAAAGHGNLFHESYTRYMEAALEPILAKIGVSVEARNYAMGGTTSAPEVALCSREIFGSDMDILTWDYGMTDGRSFVSMDLYVRRAAVETHGTVAVLGIHVDGRSGGSRQAILKRLDEMGLTALYMDPAHHQAALDNVPDTAGMPSQAAIESMPPVIRYFKCGDKIESGEPGCGQFKFNNTVCPKRVAKTSWHPGWKYHSLVGHMNAMFILDMFEDALEELAQQPNRDPSQWLDELSDELDRNYQQFVAASQSAPDDAATLAPGDKDGKIPMDRIFTTTQKYCRTARIPSQVRYRGIVTTQPVHDATTITRTTAPTDEMRLVMDSRERTKCEIPYEDIQIDYKDYFYVNALDEWKSLTIPNEGDLETFGDQNLSHGVLILCLAACSWGKCPAGMVLPEDLADGKAELRVNDVPVTNTTNFRGCYMLAHAGGYEFLANDAGQFRVAARVVDDGLYYKISSVIVV